MKTALLVVLCLFVCYYSAASVKTDCGATLTDSSGSLSTPNYPESYDNSLLCTWLITTQPNTVISLIFTRFITEPDYDFVTIYDGSTTSSPVLANYSGFSVPAGVETKSNNMLIVLSTDDLYNYLGFLAYYNSYPAGSPVPPTPPPCGETFYGEGYIQTPNYPAAYPDDIDCYWYLQTPNVSLILSFLSFDTELYNDYVSAYNGWSTEDPVILREFSGNWLDFTIETDNVTDKMLVHFHSDYSVGQKGFRAFFSN